MAQRYCQRVAESHRMAQTDTPATRWEGQPVVSALLRLAAAIVPFAASVTAGVAVAHVLGPAGAGAAAAGWWVTVFAVSSLVLWTVDRLARRLLPVAALLRLSMAFPGQAPSRFKVARLVKSTKELERRVELARTGKLSSQPGEAAETILALVAALSQHDRRTRGHAERVRVYTDLLGEQLGLARDARDKLRWASLVHDMGKLSVSTGILNKAGKPTQDEWASLRAHPDEGARLCSALLPWLGEWGKGIAEHHERFDGGGYPRGLAGKDISLAGRVVCVADAYEVMTAARAYKRPMNATAARAELVRCAGTHFDPTVVRAFLAISLTRLRLAMGPLSWLAQVPFLWRVGQVSQTAGAATATIGGAAALGLGAIAPGAHGLTGGDTPAASTAPAVTTAAAATAGTATPATPATAGASGDSAAVTDATPPHTAAPPPITGSGGTAPSAGGGTPPGAPGSGRDGDGRDPAGGGSGGLGGAVDDTTEAVDDAADDLGADVDAVVDELGDTVTDTSESLGDTVGTVDSDLGDTVGTVGGSVGGTVERTGDAVEDTSDALGDAVGGLSGNGDGDAEGEDGEGDGLLGGLGG